jgi:hypothetical protein
VAVRLRALSDRHRPSSVRPAATPPAPSTAVAELHPSSIRSPPRALSSRHPRACPRGTAPFLRMGSGEEERLPSLGASGEVPEDRIRIGKSAGGMSDYFPAFWRWVPMRLLGRPKQNKSPWWRKIIARTSDSLNDSIPHNVFFLLWSLLSHRGVVSAPLLQSLCVHSPKTCVPSAAVSV